MKFRIRHFQEVTSTNALAREQAAMGAPEGLVLVADYQSEGRGKPGRKWLSPPKKNLLFSLLIRPPIAVHRAPFLTQVVCRSVASVLKNTCHLTATFKRPNDVMVRGKKICGVLIEASSRSNSLLESAVVGIGVNVNATRDEIIPEATSVREETHRRHDRRKLLQKILTQLNKDLRVFYDPIA